MYFIVSESCFWSECFFRALDRGGDEEPGSQGWFCSVSLHSDDEQEDLPSDGDTHWRYSWSQKGERRSVEIASRDSVKQLKSCCFSSYATTYTIVVFCNVIYLIIHHRRKLHFHFSFVLVSLFLLCKSAWFIIALERIKLNIDKNHCGVFAKAGKSTWNLTFAHVTCIWESLNGTNQIWPRSLSYSTKSVTNVMCFKATSVWMVMSH